ncbi:GDSL esterase/lipase 3-like [Populus nigra]|uniref:GDSL esterase/lipase 3-like n=1 Tax=Populus nigra TaxID=3691 RepID=UPI002B27A6F5|nr:GDSL esterase/lipase 3-like [Populus nigra]
MNGVNFASAGTGALAETHQGKVIDLKTQLRYFKELEKLPRQKLSDEVAKTLLSSALYLFSIGSNDYFVPFIPNPTVLQSYNRNEYIRMVIGNLTSGIQCGLNKFELCDNASEYLFFDGIHPADEVHNQFAKLLWSGNPDVGGPYNLKTLFEE